MILSATPVSLNYGYDKDIVFNNGEVYTYDGVGYIDSSLLANAIDVSVNNDELLVLTNQTKLSDSIVPIAAPGAESYIHSFLLQDYLGNYLYATDPLNSQGSSISLTNNLISATVFNFQLLGQPYSTQLYYTTPYNNVNLYLICNTTANTISSGDVTNISPVNYTFGYILNNSTFSFVTNAPGLETQWLVSNRTSFYSTPTLKFAGISATSPNDLVVPLSATFNAVSLNSNNYNNALQTPGQSDLVKYLNIDNQLNIASKSNINTPFNYLVSGAYKTITTDNPVISANVNILKNYYSPMHNQGVVGGTALRDYNKIYTGLNESIGSDKVYLGYNASTSKIIFNKDSDTYFHYPLSAANLKLINSTLVDSGSRADVSPWRSDRISKKIADYNNYSSWGNSLNAVQNGVYFCSWLSAGNIGANVTTKPIWMDRYFNPALVNLKGLSINDRTALSGILVSGINNYPNLIWDVPSTMTFDPGVVYNYHRIGENDNNNIVQSVTGLTYHINNWNSSLVNDVTGLTAGNIVNYTTNNTALDASLKVPYYNTTNTYGIVNTADKDFTSTQGTTLSFFAYQKDWTNITGDQIAGNYFNGGIGLFNNNPILTPYFTVATYTANSYGAIQTYNTDLNLISTNAYPTFSNFTGISVVSAWATPSFVLKNVYDSNYFIVDNFLNIGNNYLSVLDPSDLLVNKSLLNIPQIAPNYYLPASAVIVDAYSIPASGSNVDIVLKTHPDSNTATYRRFSSTGTLLASAVTPGSYNNFVVDLNGNPLWYNSNIPTNNPSVSGYEMWTGTNACVNSINDVFSLSGNGTVNTPATTWALVKNGVQLFTINKPEYINCDQDDYIWITYNTNYLMKVDSYGNIVWNKQINTANPIVTKYSIRVVNFLAENTTSGILYRALIIDGKSQYIYKIDTNGNVVKSISVPGLIPGGDSTGFNYQRKYIAPTLTVPGIRARLVTRDTTAFNSLPNYITLNHGTSALSPGWHNFTITFDQSNTAKLYVDGTVTEKATIATPAPVNNYTYPSVTLSINGTVYPAGSVINVASNTVINAQVCGTATGAFLQSVSSDISPNSNFTGTGTLIPWVQGLFTGVYNGCANSTTSLSYPGPYTLYVRALAADSKGSYPPYLNVTINWAAPGATVPPDIIPATNPSVLYSIYNYKNNPQLAIGTSNFKTGTLNQWIQSPTAYLFNGGIADLRLYDNTLTDSDIKAISKNSLTNQYSDLIWNIPTGNRNYIEEIERFFLHRLPGSKSQFYNIKIKNSNITDPNVRAIVESNLRATALNTAPAYTQLRSIIWE